MGKPAPRTVPRPGTAFGQWPRLGGLGAKLVLAQLLVAGLLLVTGWVRDGHPEGDTTRLATEIAAAATRTTGIPADRVLVVFQSSPAHYAVEGGRVLPEPGEEAAWIAAAG